MPKAGREAVDTVAHQRMGDAVLRPIGRVALNASMGQTMGVRQHRIGQTAIGIMQNADLDLTHPAMKGRHETVNRDQHGRDIVSLALCQYLSHSLAKRLVDGLDPSGSLR